VTFRLGPDVPVPHIVWDLDDQYEQESRARVFAMAQSFGWPLSKSQVAEDLQLREPESPEDVVEVPMQAPAMFEARRAELAVSSPRALSSMQRANTELADAVAESQREAMTRVLDLVGGIAGRVETPEQLMTRLKLAAPDLDSVLEEAGLSGEDLEDAIARAMLTADLNGREALRAERGT